MAIVNINPATNNVVGPADSFSFDIDNTYTSLVVKIGAAGGDEYAYDYALGGAQVGYLVTIEDLGSQDRITIKREAGWNKEPVVVTVVENESGSIVQTQFQYYLTSTLLYPEGMQPYNDAYSGSLIVTEGNVAVRDDVGWQDFDANDFVVTDSGSGKVTIALDPSISGSDEDAIHDNVANEISAIAEKTVPVGGDLLIIEDSAAGYVKKKVQITNLPGGGGGTGDDALVYLGEYDIWEETNKLNPDGNGQMIYDETFHNDLEFSYTDKNAVNYTTLWQLYQGQTLCFVDASGDRSYWRHNNGGSGAGYYRDYTTYTSLGGTGRLFDEAGFDYGDGSGSSTIKVYAIGIGKPSLGGEPLPLAVTAGGDAYDTASAGSSPVYNDYENRWEYQASVYHNTRDPSPSDTWATYNHWVGRLWVNTVAGNLWVMDDLSGGWTELVSNTVQYNSVASYSFDDDTGIPNANGEADTNGTTIANTTSVQFYDNDSGGNDFSAELLSLTAGSIIEVYYAESWGSWWTVTGDPTDNGTYVTVPVEEHPDNPGWDFTSVRTGSVRLTIPGGFKRQDGTTAAFAEYFLNRTAEVNTPASGKSELWAAKATGTGDQYLKYTDEAGTRFALTPHIDTAAPTANDDVNDGHEVGQIWVKTSATVTVYCCTDNSAGAAVWTTIS